MFNERQRHDISDEVWNLLEPYMPGQRHMGKATGNPGT